MPFFGIPHCNNKNYDGLEVLSEGYPDLPWAFGNSWKREVERCKMDNLLLKGVWQDHNQ